MPTRNLVKVYAPDSYYHIYSRGVNKQPIFNDELDYAFFISLFKRYLARTPVTRPKHAPYKTFSGSLDLLSFCLMRNHIHLFVYQHDQYAIKSFMAALLTSYSRYYNQKHDRVGPLFQSRYLARIISNDSYLKHISRYIHLNPTDWQSYPYSSIKYYQECAHAEWINTTPIFDLFDTAQNYMNFLEEYDGYEISHEVIEPILAGYE